VLGKDNVTACCIPTAPSKKRPGHQAAASVPRLDNVKNTVTNRGDRRHRYRRLHAPPTSWISTPPAITSNPCPRIRQESPHPAGRKRQQAGRIAGCKPRAGTLFKGVLGTATQSRSFTCACTVLNEKEAGPKPRIRCLLHPPTATPYTIRRVFMIIKMLYEKLQGQISSADNRQTGVDKRNDYSPPDLAGLTCSIWKTRPWPMPLPTAPRKTRQHVRYDASNAIRGLYKVHIPDLSTN
jgi:hypothetical protein